MIPSAELRVCPHRLCNRSTHMRHLPLCGRSSHMRHLPLCGRFRFHRCAACFGYQPWWGKQLTMMQMTQFITMMTQGGEL